VTKLHVITAFHSFANAPENQSVDDVLGNNHCLFRHLYKMQNFGLWVEFFCLETCVIGIFDYLSTENLVRGHSATNRKVAGSIPDRCH
jgi:hypothetical protein